MIRLLLRSLFSVSAIAIVHIGGNGRRSGDLLKCVCRYGWGGTMLWEELAGREDRGRFPYTKGVHAVMLQ